MSVSFLGKSSSMSGLPVTFVRWERSILIGLEIISWTLLRLEFRPMMLMGPL